MVDFSKVLMTIRIDAGGEFTLGQLAAPVTAAWGHYTVIGLQVGPAGPFAPQSNPWDYNLATPFPWLDATPSAGRNVPPSSFHP